MQKCEICHISCSDGILLSNGGILHKECYENILKEKEEIGYKIYQCNNSINSADAKLNSLGRKLLRYIGRGTENDENLLRIINDNKKIIPGYEKDISKLKIQLRILYDYWMDYPPDWEDRRQSLLEQINFCEECGALSYSFHIHHIAPVSKGGSHKRDNLKVLCKECHQSKHKHKLGDTPDYKRATEFEVKLSKLRKAIDEDRTVTFEYRKYEGERSKRTIKPEGFKLPGKYLCVYGYCYLRNDRRTFSIRRMTKLIVN
jgi:hypothetical protein